MPPTAAPDPERLLRRLEWTVLRPLDGLLLGNYHTLFQGQGMDFAGLRPYEPGDDVRTIDWNATARRGETQVRRFHEDREIDAWFLVDTSPSLNFGSTGRLKRDLSLEAVGALASLFSRQGNRVGACLYSGGLPRLFPAARGRSAVLALLRGMAAPEAPAGETDLKVPLEAMAGVLRRRSLVFLVSDFECLPGWTEALGPLVTRHEVLAVRIQDPGESELPNLGVVWLEDSETGGQLLVDTGDPAFRRRLDKATKEREARLAAEFLRARVDSLNLSTTDDLVRALLGFAHRRRMLKNSGGAA